MNPTMFFYDVDSLRSIQFIPFVASTIPADSQLIPWAPTVLDAVAKRKTVNGHVVAYFADADGSVTYDQTKAVHLYLYSALNSIMFFEQELLAQPAWLNNKEGAIRILRSCLGDFSALVGLGILDGKTEMVIQNALKGMSSSTSPAKQ